MNEAAWRKSAVALSALILTSWASRPAPAVCVGDCLDYGSVTIGNLVTMVNIALDTAPVSTCSAGDANADGRITIEEITLATTAALNGCPAPPTPRPTPVPGSAVAELAATGIDRYLGIAPSSVRRNGEWDEYFFDPAAEGPICLRGGRYQVNIRRGSSNSVVFYLEGGGACWNYATCWQQPIAKLTANSAFGAGILENDNPVNPVRDWNIVYVPYCDGSVFAGDNIVDYQGRRTYHHGLYNLSAAMTLLQREFPNPDRILVSGSSAGGYGTFTGYGLTRVAFPELPLLVFDDSGPGLQNPEDATTANQRIQNWNFLQFQPPSCTDCSRQFAYLSTWALDHDPTLRIAYFNYLQDPVLRFFLSLSSNGFEELLRSVTGELHTNHPDRLKRFLPNGEVHTVLLSPAFYTETLSNTTVRDWTADFLSNGSRWQDLVAE